MILEPPLVFKKGQSIESMHSSMRAAERVGPAAMPAFQKRMEKFPAPKQYMRWFVTFVTFLKTGCIVAENRCFVKLFQIFWRQMLT
jgi:hypothetical protein